MLEFTRQVAIILLLVMACPFHRFLVFSVS